MPGKRPRPLQRTTSQSLLNFEAIGNQCSPLPEQHPVEKHKQGKGPVLCAHRQVIGFAAPTAFAEAEIVEKKAVSPGACQRPCGPHRSGLCDLFPRPCWKKENAPGIGLGIVAAMEKDDGAGEMKGMQVDCVGQDQQQQAVYQPLFAPPPAPKASYPIPVSGLKQQLGFENVAVKPQAPPRSPRESYIGIMAPAGQGGVAQGGGGQAGTGASLLAWAQSTESILEEGSKLFTSLSSTPVSRSATGDSSGFTALQFLDACYFCKRRFGEDRDIYMYRGDKAFCSVECRHYQIVQDERLDKCSAAALSSGAITPARHNISQRNRVMAVAAGTAAAA